MTIHQTNSYIDYVGDGSQTTFNYDFKIFTATNLVVYVDGVMMTYVTDYNVTNSGTESGGDVIFVTAPADQAAIHIERILDYQQLLDLIEYDRFPAESVEGALDYLCLLIQQNAAEAERVIQAPAGVTDLQFPPAGDGEFIKYTDDGTALETADINELGTQIIPTATDGEIIAGIQTQTRLISPYQTKLATQTHETAEITSVFDVAYIEVVDALPATPEPNKMYLIRE